MTRNRLAAPAAYIKPGATLHYRPFIKYREGKSVTIEGEPYQLGDGSWVVKTTDPTSRVVSCEALSEEA